ncbi:MAG: hypothetical protein EBQ99_02520 [Planctomycetes bacterium]|nr:hypothetical protein [Planctomycetota bacterium]
MRSESVIRAWLLLLVVSAIAGCRPYVMSNSAVDQYPSGDQEIEFLGAVERMPAVTNNDALHGFLLLQDGADACTSFESRVQEGQKRGWFRGSTPQKPNEAAKVGWMATAGCVVMGVDGGVSMRLFGPLPRYATRELVYMEILPLRTENQVLTGAEFVDFVNRLDRIAGRNRRERVPSPLGTPAGHADQDATTAQPSTPLGMPAGSSVETPGNEAAIQEGPLPDRGPIEAAPPPPAARTPAGSGLPAPARVPSVPPKKSKAPSSPPAVAPAPTGGSSTVPGPMRPAKPAAPSENPAGS